MKNQHYKTSQVPRNSQHKKPISHPGKTNRKKRHRKSHFFRNLSIFIGVVFIGFFFFFTRLWNYLADYQNTLPSMLGDEILSAYKSADTATIKKYCDTLPSALQDDMIFHRYLNDVIGKEDIYYYESSAQLEQKEKASITYTFSVNEQTFATLVVSRTSAESNYGFPIYEIASLEQYSLQNYTFVQAPGTQILLNAAAIDSAYVTDQRTIGTIFEQIERGPFFSTTYVLPDYLAYGEASAIDVSGNPCTLIWNEEHTICTSSYSPSEDALQRISSFTTNAAKEYAMFATIKYASRDSLLTYLYPGTDFYKAIKTYDTEWGISKTADSFASIAVTDFVQYSPTEYSCAVSFDYLVKQGNTEKTYPLSFTCYVTTKNGSPQIVNLQTNAATD